MSDCKGLDSLFPFPARQGRGRGSYRVGYIDHAGTVVIKAVFSYGRAFREGLASVMVDDRWGYIDVSGTMAIAPAFQNALCFSEDRAQVIQGGRRGFIDHDGRLVVQPRYEIATSFSQGLAWVMIQGVTVLSISPVTR